MHDLSASIFVTNPARSDAMGTTSVASSCACLSCLPDGGPRPSADAVAMATSIEDLENLEKLATEPQTRPHVLHAEEAELGAVSDATSGTLPPCIPRDAGFASHIHGIPITYRRPSVSSIITTAVQQAPSGHKILVVGCGPRSLMTEVREVAAGCMTSQGPAVDVHCEQFGW